MQSQHEPAKAANISIENCDENQHENEVNTSLIFNCKLCNIDFSVERDLRIHRSLHRDDGKFECVECNKQYSCKRIVKKYLFPTLISWLNTI